jgi:hypothetical protein
VVCEWGLNQRAETVELVVSELATKAVLASAQLMGGRYPGNGGLAGRR